MTAASAGVGLLISFGYCTSFPLATHETKICCSQAGGFAGCMPAPVVMSALYPFSAFSAIPGTTQSGEKHLKTAHH